MTSMSSSGGEEGEGSSRWLPKLTTCSGSGKGEVKGHTNAGQGS